MPIKFIITTGYSVWLGRQVKQGEVFSADELTKFQIFKKETW